jgi:hypothetical protein
MPVADALLSDAREALDVRDITELMPGGQKTVRPVDCHRPEEVLRHAVGDVRTK